MASNSAKECLDWILGKNLLTKRVAMHWNRLPKLSGTWFIGHDGVGSTIGLNDFFLLKQFYDSTIKMQFSVTDLFSARF